MGLFLPGAGELLLLGAVLAWIVLGAPAAALAVVLRERFARG